MSSGPCFSQTVKATLLGTVKDIGGGVIASAKVTITETNTGINRSGQTNESGNYTFPDIAPGVYQVTVERVNCNFQSLLDLAPGTTPATFQHSQFFNAGATLQTEVNGQMRHGNNYQIEGTDNNQRTGLLQILIPPSEAIQIVSISTSNHEPELGRGSGAIANVVLKSGSNKIHGMAYELHQNSALDARSFFNVTVGHLVYNRFGAQIGDPIKKNKLFYFTDYLRIMDREANTNRVTIPSMDFRRGDLSAGRNQVYDPATGDAATGARRTPFPGTSLMERLAERKRVTGLSDDM